MVVLSDDFKTKLMALANSKDSELIKEFINVRCSITANC